MRVLLKVDIPTIEGNEAARSGTLTKKIQSIIEDQKPEAVYFTDSNGLRSGYLFLNLNDSSKIPAIAEPWFLTFNAEVELKVVMNPDDLMKAEPHISEAVKKYG